MDEDFATRAAEVIPATVIMFSGCQDSQTSADVYNTSSFGLPSDSGPGGAGGACTSSMIKALSDSDQYTWVSLLQAMRGILTGQYTQVPMLSSSRSMDLNCDFSVKNPESNGNMRALLVGINYVGQNGELRGCHNDVETMRRYLEGQGYEENNMKILLDDGEHEDPNKDNIIAAFQWLVDGAEAGDSLFFHYSGHGASVRDDEGDEADGKDEALVPVDYNSAGLLRDDDVFKYLVGPLKAGVSLTCVLDCCHSGTILDLPFVFKADDQGMEAAENGDVSSTMPNQKFNFGKIVNVIKDNPGLCVAAAALTGFAYYTGGQEKAQKVGQAMMQAVTSDDPVAGLMGAASSWFG